MKILEVTNVDFALRQFVLPVMRALRDAGHDVQGVCAEEDTVQPVREEGFIVHTLPMARSLSPIAQLRSFWSLIQLFRQEKPDIVHAHMPISGILARLAAFLCGVKCIAYTGHGFLFNQPGPLWRRTLSIVMEWLAGRVTDCYMTVSGEEALDAQRLGLHSSPYCIHNGRDSRQYYPDHADRHSLRNEMEVPEGRCIILAVSRLVRHKGYPELLRAMEEIPQAELWIVGERLPSDHGIDLSSIFRRAEERLGDRVRFLGARHDVNRIMRAVDIFVLPSHFEGFPMVIIEAMLTALPVVACDVKGAREQVVNGVTGYVVSPGLSAPLRKALFSLVENPDLSKKMGQEGREKARAIYNEADILARVVSLLTQGG